MQTSDFDYQLPPHLIAQTPLEPRDSSRLIVLHRDTGHIDHHHFSDLVEYLREGDALVFNDSRVIPARLHATREGSSSRVEILLLSRLEPGVWRAIGRPGRALRPGHRFQIQGSPRNDLSAEVIDASRDGVKTLRFSSEDGLEHSGRIALPPYIHTPLQDPERYQTVYAREPGSVAAPTAGLHFTPKLLETLGSRGVAQVHVTLHVGLDTFQPVRGEDPSQHLLHGEYFQLDEAAAARINATRKDGGRIIAVGTTSVRLLEQAAAASEDRGSGELLPTSGWAQLYILPGYQFRMVDAMLTNFHLPRTTLLMLVSAFAGRERVLGAYQEAIHQEYRFYSFGDGMLIL